MLEYEACFVFVHDVPGDHLLKSQYSLLTQIPVLYPKCPRVMPIGN